MNFFGKQIFHPLIPHLSRDPSQNHNGLAERKKLAEGFLEQVIAVFQRKQ